MKSYNKNGRETPEPTPEERLRVLLLNALTMYAEEHSDRYNSSSEFWRFIYGELGTDKEELEELGINLSEDLRPLDN